MIGQQVLTKKCPARLRVNSERTAFEVIADRAKIVQRIFERAARGQGSNVITRLLNREGVPVFGKSNGWIESYVTKILKNRAVLGEFQPHTKINGKRTPKGHVAKDYFPKIIDEELFLKVQVGRRERALVGGGRRGPKQRNLFTHIAKCRYCGSSMRFINKGEGPKGGKYLRCSASVRGMDCVSQSWRYESFEKSVFAFVREFDLLSLVEDSHQRSQVASVREQLTIQKEKLSTQELERQRVLELIIGRGDAAKEYLENHLDQLSDEIVDTESKIRVLVESEARPTTSPKIEADAEEQLLALTRLTSEADFRDRLLVSTKLRELILQIDVSVEGDKPGFEKVKQTVLDNEEDPEFRNRLIEEIRRSRFTGPRSNPYFTVFFHNGTSRVVYPEKEDPTSLHRQFDIDDDGVRLTGSSGLIDVVFPPRLSKDD